MAFDPKHIISVIENIDKKIPLPEFCTKLRSLNLPSSNSWTKTKALLTDILEAVAIQDAQKESFEQLYAWIFDYLRYFSKSVFVFKLNPDIHGDINSVHQAFLKGAVGAGMVMNFPLVFPSVISKEQLAGLNGATLLRAELKGAGHIDYIFSQVREYQVRTEIQVSLDEIEAVKKLEGYSKIIGVKSALHEHVDVVRFNVENGSVELYLDITRPGNVTANSQEIARRAKSYTDIINIAVSQNIQNFVLPSSLNLFDAIRKIYDSLEGSICELGFATTTSNSVKHERMKLLTADLRTEPWHAGGMMAVSKGPNPDEVDMYRLSVSWVIPGSTDKPVLSIPGSYKSLATAEVDYAIILGCKEQVSFNFAYSRLLAFAA